MYFINISITGCFDYKEHPENPHCTFTLLERVVQSMQVNLQLLFYSYLRQQSDDPLIALSPHVETNSDPSEVFCSVLEPVVTHISSWHLLTVLQDKSSSVLFHCSYYKILLVDLAGNDPASARHY